ncbi:response regulator [Sporosarcina sp. ACRSL]|uniref:response regulator n=1 Tax=Sporosarcina sp. ACRSL TaxID=2918215 RepID=UPI001EF5E12C|nr:response regulator [Sporosarcina sp. ACRSL]MCG7344111.1 response regulator [Sporosarcina sp. ACRSL]
MILLADDSRFMRNWLKQILQKHGYIKFAEASNGEEAIQMYRLVKPEIVFLDITMPHVDGLAALEQIMEINPKAKVIMCSALSTHTNRTAALRLGATEFIVKPFFDDVNKLMERIRETKGGHPYEEVFI